jgi:hypothetical protein
VRVPDPAYRAADHLVNHPHPLSLGLWRLIAGGDLSRVEVSWTALLALLAAVPVTIAGIVQRPLPMARPASHRPQLTYE